MQKHSKLRNLAVFKFFEKVYSITQQSQNKLQSPYLTAVSVSFTWKMVHMLLWFLGFLQQSHPFTILNNKLPNSWHNLWHNPSFKLFFYLSPSMKSNVNSPSNNCTWFWNSLHTHLEATDLWATDLWKHNLASEFRMYAYLGTAIKSMFLINMFSKHELIKDFFCRHFWSGQFSHSLSQQNKTMLKKGWINPDISTLVIWKNRIRHATPPCFLERFRHRKPWYVGGGDDCSPARQNCITCLESGKCCRFCK